MKQVLIITYDFPPSSIGIWRTLKFCHYMEECGWHPSILTVKPAPSSRWDNSPLAELPPNTEVRRTEALEHGRVAHLLRSARKSKSRAGTVQPPAGNRSGFLRGVNEWMRRWVLIPDERVGWYPFAVAAGARWMREKKFDAVYSTSFPSTAHLVGAKLSKKFHVPLMADFRDIWIGNYTFYHPATRLHDRLQRKLEGSVVKQAASVISATQQITDDFLARYPDEPPAKFSTITNGYDPRDFDFVGAQPDREHFTITYAGTMYGATSPHCFLKALATVLGDNPDWRPRIRLRFVGSMVEPYRRMIDDNGLGDITTVEPYVAHDEALRIMAAADALLLIVARVPGSHIMLTQKIFEYAAARRPILGLVPDGAARDFLLELGEGEIAPPDDVAAIELSIKRMFADWLANGRRLLADNECLMKYQRRILTKHLCAELDRIVE